MRVQIQNLQELVYEYATVCEKKIPPPVLKILYELSQGNIMKFFSFYFI